MAAPAPVPTSALSPSTNTTSTDIPTAPPLRLGVSKRYDDEQEKKLKKLKLYIEKLTRISTVRIIEGYLREVQQDANAQTTLFQIIPVGIIHLCYKFCTQFKYYLLLIYSKSMYSNEMLDIKMLGINDIERTNKDLSKQIKHLTAGSHVNKVSINSVNKIYPPHIPNILSYIPQLTLSKNVAETLTMDNKQNDIPLSAVFRAYSTGGMRQQRLEMLYFYSPYFYDYTLDVANNKKLLYNQCELPVATYPSTLINSTVHIPFSNQLVTFCKNKKQNVVGVMDLYDLKWLTNKENYKWITLSEQTWSNHSLCLCGNKLFLIGGVNEGNKKGNVTNSVEILDCSKLANLYNEDHCKKSNKYGMKSVMLTSKMNVCRVFGCCDVMNVKNNQIVIGGGYEMSRNRYSASYSRMRGDNASNSIEFYDHNKDKWMLHGATTKFPHQEARLWCSGNLLFIVGGCYSQRGSGIANVGKIECIDIRDNTNKWRVLDARDIQKLYCLYNQHDSSSYKTQGIFI